MIWHWNLKHSGSLFHGQSFRNNNQHVLHGIFSVNDDIFLFLDSTCSSKHSPETQINISFNGRVPVIFYEPPFSPQISLTFHQIIELKVEQKLCFITAFNSPLLIPLQLRVCAFHKATNQKSFPPGRIKHRETKSQNRLN